MSQDSAPPSSSISSTSPLIQSLSFQSQQQQQQVLSEQQVDNSGTTAENISVEDSDVEEILPPIHLKPIRAEITNDEILLHVINYLNSKEKHAIQSWLAESDNKKNELIGVIGAITAKLDQWKNLYE